MKKRNGWQSVFCVALCIAYLMTDTTAVYGTEQETEWNAEEAQKRLQEEQNAHNEAVAEQNRREVERAVTEKVAAQYAAMGRELPAEVWNGKCDGGENITEDMAAPEKEEATPKELWEQLADNGDFSALYENVAEKQEKGEIEDDTLSAFLESLTIANSPVTDEVFYLTDITYDELKELFPLNNAVFRERDLMRGFVRHNDTGVFVFQYFWDYWREEGTVLSVKYKDVNERGNFTSIVFDSKQEETKSIYSWRNNSFVGHYGYEGLTDYNLGCEGLSSYLLKNKCLHVWDFVQLTGVEINILDEKEKPKEGILCRSFDTEYGAVTAFYYMDEDSWQEYFAIKFEEHDIYDYILAQGATGGEMRVEVKMK